MKHLYLPVHYHYTMSAKQEYDPNERYPKFEVKDLESLSTVQVGKIRDILKVIDITKENLWKFLRNNPAYHSKLEDSVEGMVRNMNNLEIGINQMLINYENHIEIFYYTSLNDFIDYLVYVAETLGGLELVYSDVIDDSSLYHNIKADAHEMYLQLRSIRNTFERNNTS